MQNSASRAVLFRSFPKLLDFSDKLIQLADLNHQCAFFEGHVIVMLY